MDKEALHRLRNSIAIPISEALALIKKHKGDIAACEQDYYDSKLVAICRITGCEKETAQKYYQLHKQNITKAIESINNREVIFTMRETPIPRNTIGFALWPEKENSDRYESVKRDDVFIPREDFDLIMEECQASCQENFSIYSVNYFDKPACENLIMRIQEIQPKDEKEKKFLQELINWFEEKLEYAACIAIEGNL